MVWSHLEPKKTCKSTDDPVYTVLIEVKYLCVAVAIICFIKFH